MILGKRYKTKQTPLKAMLTQLQSQIEEISIFAFLIHFVDIIYMKTVKKPGEEKQRQISNLLKIF